MVLSLTRWINKVAVVTGASSGIGAAITKRLVKEGIIVAGLARRIELLEHLAESLKNEKGTLHPIKVDVSKEEDVINSFNYINKNLGPIHILVNNAGISRSEKLFQISTKDVKNIFDVNVLGLYMCAKAAVQNMTESNVDGQIINMNSISGHSAFSASKLNVYSATKFAVTALNETIRLELIRMDTKIKVTSLSPGLVVSGMTVNDENNQRRANILKSWPILQAEDIADAIVYILSTPKHVQIHELTIKPIGEKH